MKKRQAIVIGAGGNARVVLSILNSIKSYNIFGILDLKDNVTGEIILGTPVIGSVDKIKDFD